MTDHLSARLTDRDAATPRTRDFREAIELLRIGCNDGWNHGELAMAEQIVARYDADTMPAGEYFAGLRERIEEKPNV